MCGDYGFPNQRDHERQPRHRQKVHSKELQKIETESEEKWKIQ